MSVIGNQTNVTIAGQPVSVTTTQAAGSANRYYGSVNSNATMSGSYPNFVLSGAYTVPAGTYFIGQAGSANAGIGNYYTTVISIVSPGPQTNITYGAGTTIGYSAVNGSGSSIGSVLTGVLFYI